MKLHHRLTKKYKLSDCPCEYCDYLRLDRVYLAGPCQEPQNCGYPMVVMVKGEDCGRTSDTPLLLTKEDVAVILTLAPQADANWQMTETKRAQAKLWLASHPNPYVAANK
jgi:hypothetical protein